MSFFTADDEAARRDTQTPPPSQIEVERFSRAEAHQKLNETLEQIRESYRRGSRGVHFSYDRSPFVGSKSSVDPRLNYSIMVNELVQLVRAEGIECVVSDDNTAIKSSFSISF